MSLFIPISVLVTIMSLNAEVHTAKPQDGILFFLRSFHPGLAEQAIMMTKRGVRPFSVSSWTPESDWMPDGRHTGAPQAMRLPFSQIYHKFVGLLGIKERKKESKTGRSWFLNRLTKFQPFTFTSGPAQQQICQEDPTSQAPSSKLREARKHSAGFGISYGRG